MARKRVEIITSDASWKHPISFFSPPKLMPVFPPTAASTALSSVVGMLTKLMPRLKVAAAKPPKSVTTPPPRFTTNDLRVAPPCSRLFHTWVSVSRFLHESPTPMVMICASAKWRLRILGSTTRAVFSSTITARWLCGLASRMASSARATSLVNTRFCDITAIIVVCVYNFWHEARLHHNVGTCLWHVSNASTNASTHNQHAEGMSLRDGVIIGGFSSLLHVPFLLFCGTKRFQKQWQSLGKGGHAGVNDVGTCFVEVFFWNWTSGDADGERT